MGILHAQYADAGDSRPIEAAVRTLRFGLVGRL
jgi:hypothetical protein